MIHVAYGLHDKTGRYSKFTGTSILSMFENISQPPPPAVTVHILHDNTLTQDNRDKFIYLAGRYNQIIKFYNVEQLFPNLTDDIEIKLPMIKKMRKRFTIAALYRLLIDQVIPDDIDKIIYLDSDIIVNLDISELWQVEFGENLIAAVSIFDEIIECKKENYLLNSDFVKNCNLKVENIFNSGVMLINLKKIRESDSILDWGHKNISEEVLQFAIEDQEYLNICFSSKLLKLPTKFNNFVYFLREGGINKLERKIYHYIGIGGGNSLGFNMNSAYDRLYWKYFIKTPFFTEDTLGNIFDGVREVYAEHQNLMIRISAIISGKRRTFVTLPQNVEALKKIFYVSESEEFFQIDSPDWLSKLATAMKASLGKKIFIILAGGSYPQLGASLIQAGFAEGRDFINGEIFLSSVYGIPAQFYSLLKKI